MFFKQCIEGGERSLNVTVLITYNEKRQDLFFFLINDNIINVNIGIFIFFSFYKQQLFTSIFFFF